ncbi:MAG: helix-turn-helix domain-containing protein [Mediterranea sp.]|jgi:hypothetical protein|nr:helix-turn-helix domain-containing protein [Mediterranea sp.]
MRNKREMQEAVAILKLKGDDTSLAQARVISLRYTEMVVFACYIKEVKEEDRDDGIYFPMRDAARFVEGRLTLEELIPDYMDYWKTSPATIVPEEREDMIALPRSEWNALVRRVRNLERLAGNGGRKERKPAEWLPPGADMSGMMTQARACEYIGCDKDTIKRWADRGTLRRYGRKGDRRVYYSRGEIDEKMPGLRANWKGHAS